MNTSNRANPILLQIPLLVTPGKYIPPRSVNLPYDFVELPDHVPSQFVEDLGTTNDRLEQLLNQQIEAQERLAYLYNEDTQSDRIKPYNEWKSELSKMAPGYFGGRMSVMSPTVNRLVSSTTTTTSVTSNDESMMNVDENGSENGNEEVNESNGDHEVSNVSQELLGLQI